MVSVKVIYQLQGRTSDLQSMQCYMLWLAHVKAECMLSTLGHVQLAAHAHAHVVHLSD